MNADDRLVDVRHAVAERLDDLAHLARRGVADRVGNVDRRGAGGDRGLDHLAEEIGLGAGGVLGRVFDVVAEAAGPLHPRHRLADHLLLAHFQLELAVDRAGGEKDVQPRAFGVSQGVAGPIDVGVAAAGQPADHRAAHVAGDFTHRLEIAGRRDREARFDHVHAQLDQRVGEFQLFGQIHAGAGRLLAVAERGVEDHNVSRCRRSRIGHEVQFP